MKTKSCLLIVLAFLMGALTACGMSQTIIHVPNLQNPGVTEAIESAAINKAYSLGYKLDSNVRGNLSFSKKVSRNEYYIRVAIGNITDIGGKPGVIVECWTKDDIVNPFVSGTREDMETVIKQAANL